ncbi:hypothetical protein VTI74DRAFT_3435 [Chaetomium olivicolor]
MRQQIQRDPEMVVALEISRSLRARCRAGVDCVYLRADARSGSTITSLYRICVHGVDNMDWYGKTKHFYHVECFELMIHLPDLLHSKFKMDSDSGDWGFMVRKWFEHKGRIDLDKIAGFLEELADYKAKYHDWSSVVVESSFHHGRECVDKGVNVHALHSRNRPRCQSLIKI